MRSGDSDPQLLTSAEVAALLRVSVATVNRWTKAGTIVAVEVGGVRRFRRADIDALVAAPAVTA